MMNLSCFHWSMLLALVALLFLSVLLAVLLHRRWKSENLLNRSLRKGIKKEREATSEIMELSKDVIAGTIDEVDFLPRFTRYARIELQSKGGALLIARDDGFFHSFCISGNFPLLTNLPSELKKQLLSDATKYREFSSDYKTVISLEQFAAECEKNKGYMLYRKKYPDNFPEELGERTSVLLAAPIYVNSQIFACIALCSGTETFSPQLSANDGNYLIRLAKIASQCLSVIKTFRERSEYELNIQKAREEGMMQVSAGVIHNIGNAITVARLTIDEFMRRALVEDAVNRPENMLLDELLPEIRKHLEQRDLEEFLLNDPRGKLYIEGIESLLGDIRKMNVDAGKYLQSLDKKLAHISDIIELQQRFVGELGTENRIKLDEVLRSSISIFEESLKKREISIKCRIDESVPEILMDPSMMAQVFINIIKNAVEAMDKQDDGEITISLEQRQQPDGSFALIKISDNGPGIPPEIKDRIFDFGFSSRGKGNGRGMGLHSCLHIVNKYGGTIKVDSAPGRGTAFTISLPLSVNDSI